MDDITDYIIIKICRINEYNKDKKMKHALIQFNVNHAFQF